MSSRRVASLVLFALAGASAGCANRPRLPQLFAPSYEVLPGLAGAPERPLTAWQEVDQVGAALDQRVVADVTGRGGVPAVLERPFGVVGFRSRVDAGALLDGLFSLGSTLLGRGSGDSRAFSQVAKALPDDVADAVVLRLFKAGAQQLIDMQNLADIQVELERRPAGAGAGGAEGDRVVWTGSLDHMVWLGDVTRCELLLIGSCDLQRDARQLEQRRQISEADQRRYAQEDAEWRRSVFQILKRARDELARSDQELARFQRELADFDAAVEIYTRPGLLDLLLAPLFFVTIHDEEWTLEQQNRLRTARQRAFDALNARRTEVAALEQRVTALFQSTPTLQWCLDEAAEQVQAVTIPYVVADLRARVVETATGRLRWVYRGFVQHRDERVAARGLPCSSPWSRRGLEGSDVEPDVATGARRPKATFECPGFCARALAATLPLADL